MGPKVPTANCPYSAISRLMSTFDSFGSFFPILLSFSLLLSSSFFLLPSSSFLAWSKIPSLAQAEKFGSNCGLFFSLRVIWNLVRISFYQSFYQMANGVSGLTGIISGGWRTELMEGWKWEVDIGTGTVNFRFNELGYNEIPWLKKQWLGPFHFSLIISIKVYAFNKICLQKFCV